MTEKSSCSPLISIIVPVYKVEKYLDKCVESIINQTYANIEIILVDDGSPDKCPAMCDEWALRDSRIKVIHKENGGLSSARNAGLDIASGEFFGFVDSDDYILPEMYETLLRIINENDADLSICSFEEVDERGEILPDRIDTTGTFIDEILTGDELLRKCLKVNWRYVVAWNRLYRTSVFGGIRFPEVRHHEDEFTAHHFFGMCRKAAITGRKMYFYVRRYDSLTGEEHRSFSLEEMKELGDMYAERYEFLRGKGMNDLAEQAVKGNMLNIREFLKQGSYLANFRDFNRRILWCAEKCLRSGSIGLNLRLVKALLAVAINIARDICRKSKGAIRRIIFFRKYAGIKKICRNKENKCAFVFGAPFHSNMGDQAQSYCTELWLRENYPEHTPVIIDTGFASYRGYKLFDIIRENIKPGDMIFLHSGYHATDLYMSEENLNRKVIQTFPDYRIVALPQTVNYISRDEEKNASSIYGSHKNLVFMCRDEVSYAKAESIFPKARLLLFPDIVTMMIGRFHFTGERSGILFCMRNVNDKESLHGRKIAGLSEKWKEKYGTADFTDTTISIKPGKIEHNRQEILEKMWEDFSRYKLIVTDRYHGTIFALIACTPVIVLPSTDHKLSSGVKWFPESFRDYVHYVPEIDSLESKIDEILAGHYDYTLPEYFKENYYDRLKEILG